MSGPCNRYALMEALPDGSGGFKFHWAATDLSRSSAVDAERAWGYRARSKGGDMFVIEDSQGAFDEQKDFFLSLKKGRAS